ncbi:hypothetical protein DB29_04189 [Shouchella clausii]|nr:hypothetical protein DB29_04189 [Shouchella clausii]
MVVYHWANVPFSLLVAAHSLYIATAWLGSTHSLVIRGKVNVIMVNSRTPFRKK